MGLCFDRYLDDVIRGEYIRGEKQSQKTEEAQTKEKGLQASECS
jgi:hypothetical protein